MRNTRQGERGNYTIEMHNKKCLWQDCDFIRSPSSTAATLVKAIDDILFHPSPDATFHDGKNKFHFVPFARNCLDQSSSVKINLIEEKNFTYLQMAFFVAEDYSFFACNMLKVLLYFGTSAS